MTLHRSLSVWTRTSVTLANSADTFLRLQLHLLLVALLCPAVVSGQVGDTFSGPVIRVADGDTISVRRDGETVRIRLDGIDTPESDQPFGTHASAFTSAHVLNKRVTVQVRDVDRYGRLVSRVQIDGEDLSVALVTEVYRTRFLGHTFALRGRA